MLSFDGNVPFTFDDVMRGSKRRRFDNRCFMLGGILAVLKLSPSPSDEIIFTIKALT